MIYFLLAANLLFTGAYCSVSNYEPFTPMNPLSLIENNIPLETFSNRKSLQSNRVIECDMKDMFKSVGLNELEELIETLAVKKITTPFAVLRMLQKRMKNKEDIEQTLFNSIDRVPISDHISPVNLPPPLLKPPISNGATYSLPSNDPTSHALKEDTDVVIVPVVPPQNSLPNRLPSLIKTEFMSRNQGSNIFGNMGSSIGKINHAIPDMFSLPPVKTSQLKPPFGATIHVDAKDPLNPINKDIIVTVSPLMTVLEALRQAENIFQNVLGLSHNIDVITFSHSSVMDCYIVNRIHDTINNEEFAWRVSIVDRDSQMVYNNFCLPSGRDAFVKPGMRISLSYVPL